MLRQRPRHDCRNRNNRELPHSLRLRAGRRTGRDVHAGVILQTTKMKKLTLGVCLLLVLPGCARFSTTQTDNSYENGEQVRQITTKASAYTFWASKSALATWKATQSDKTQGASVGGLSQSADATTNMASMVEAIARGVATALKP